MSDTNGERRKCFWVRPYPYDDGNFYPSIVTENEPGHHRTDWNYGADRKLAQEAVAELNRDRFNLSTEDAEQIVFSSMSTAWYLRKLLASDRPTAGEIALTTPEPGNEIEEIIHGAATYLCKDGNHVDDAVFISYVPTSDPNNVHGVHWEVDGVRFTVAPFSGGWIATGCPRWPHPGEAKWRK